jgi:hypothetical protein
MDLQEIDNWSLLPLLPPLNSSFTSVTLYLDRDPDHIERSLISSFVRALDQITVLHVPTLDPVALEHVASLATLKCLDISNAGPGNLSPGLLWPLRFCVLTSLSFYTAPFQFIVDLIHGLSNSPVASFYLGCLDLPTENTMRALCLALSTGIAHSTLSDLQMKNHYYVHRPDMARGFDGHVISPLFCFGCRIWK